MSPTWFPEGGGGLLDSISSDQYIAWRSDDTFASIWRTANKSPVLIQDFPLNRIGRKNLFFSVLIDKDGSRAVIDQINGFQVWDIINRKKIKDIQLSQDIVSLRFSLDGATLICRLPGGVIDLYTLDSGEKFARIVDVAADLIYYDASCHRVLVWTNEGRVLRYDEGRQVLNRWFWPIHKCN